MSSSIERLDAQIADIFKDWSYISTTLAVLIVAFLAYPIIFAEEPDTHPLLLERQSAASPVRNKNESAVYRSPEVPHGYPLKSGLNVRDDGAPKWSSGKDGDIRDIWREVRRGGETGKDGKVIPKGLIMTVYGKEQTTDHDIDELTKEIIVLGKHLKESGVKAVAIYLPNSIEYLLTIFACSFYGLSPVLLPYNQPHDKIYELVNSLGVDGLVCAAGNLPLDGIATSCPKLRQIVWVVEKTCRHMDWAGVPEAGKGQLSVNVWHDLVESATAVGELPSNEIGDKPADIVTVWQPAQPGAKSEIVTFTHSNIVAAVSSLISAVPLRQRLNSGDLVLAANTFTHHYVLCQTFAALFMHASLAINSVAEPGVDLALASRSVSPTVIIASAETLAELHTRETAALPGLAQKFGKYSQAQTMSAGRMPTDNVLFKFLAPSASAQGNRPGTLRLIFVSERVGAGTPPLTSTMLSDLRIFTKARICYALTAAKVAGAIAQTYVFDYRRDDGVTISHFGVPLGSVELKLATNDDRTVAGATPEGDLVVVGPSVVGGEVNLGVRARFRQDGTVNLI